MNILRKNSNNLKGVVDDIEYVGLNFREYLWV